MRYEAGLEIRFQEMDRITLLLKSPGGPDERF
jgi:hypothetical protein